MKPERKYIQLQNKRILRDGELFSIRLGMGFYDRDLANRFGDDVVSVPEERAVWLPAETQEIYHQIDDKRSILIEGGLGAGKSALLYGLRSLYREEGRPYFYFDGHYQKTSIRKINSGLMWAKINNACVFWDSMDYLLLSPSRKRKLPKKDHAERTNAAADILEDYLTSGGHIVGTTHKPDWLDTYGDPELIGTHWLPLTNSMHIHNVRGEFDNENELINFYQGELGEESARFLASLPENRGFLDYLEDVSPHLSDEILDSLQSYRIAKLIAIDPRGENQDLLIQINQFLEGEGEPKSIWGSILDFVKRKNEQTKKISGNN